METFVPKSIVQSPFIKPKVFRRHIRHQVELLYKTQYLSKDEIKLEFLKFIATHVHHFSGHVFLATLLVNMEYSKFWTQKKNLNKKLRRFEGQKRRSYDNNKFELWDFRLCWLQIKNSRST